MAGKQPKDAFPLLKSAEILQCLNELGIASSEDDLLHPTGLKVQHIYASFNELLLHRKREDMAQPDFEGLQELEFPELHEQSVPMIGFLSACQKLMAIAGVGDFTMSDLIKPEARRVRRSLSAVINLAKYHEDKLPGYMQFSQETDALLNAKASLEEESERLLSARRQAEQRRAEEEPALQQMEAENEQRQVTVRELFNSHTAILNESHALKAKVQETRDASRGLSFELLNAREEAESLRKQIAPDPRALKDELQALHDAVALEQAALKSLEGKCSDAAKGAAAIEAAEGQLDELARLQAEAEAEAQRLKETRRGIKAVAGSTLGLETERAELAHQVRAVTQRIGHCKERLERQKEQHAAKEEDARAALSLAERQWGELSEERERHERQQDDSELALRELRDKHLYARMEHEAVAARLQQLQQKLSLQVRAYHQTVLSAMGSASESTQGLAAQGVAC
ncbi:hypothetical protein EMIHUDRAFT_362808 [Emiliania huxleyi CCMP1516]|uniref:Kinetochore protein Nuf2 n=3 Tax=Emiliania huxleyi TaxID=2903 RepID=A0A0D3KJN6_EMIH1|nr:hypothetical protein EMIHUDRAFT_362808 [Emiliania huxleyi CCMP1516]EOD35971.1 hypothetical protein EMIHUDRAFT_362808 [Emiliania huxleyi CCMP1516]|eukprot:XP_005788400.1 hypothetical protein EMIHUDRAFT_362808 [Emiliania huxleyi CCMP1516]